MATPPPHGAVWLLPSGHYPLSTVMRYVIHTSFSNDIAARKISDLALSIHEGGGNVWVLEDPSIATGNHLSDDVRAAVERDLQAKGILVYKLCLADLNSGPGFRVTRALNDNIVRSFLENYKPHVFMQDETLSSESNGIGGYSGFGLNKTRRYIIRQNVGADGCDIGLDDRRGRGVVPFSERGAIARHLKIAEFAGNSGGGTAPPKVIGEIEEPADSAVQTSASMRVRGWILQSSCPEAKAVSIRIAGRMHVARLDILRTGVSAPSRQYEIVGFECNIPLERVPCRSQMDIGIQLADGQVVPWRTYRVWRPSDVPAVPRLPLIVVESNISVCSTFSAIKGQVRGAPKTWHAQLWRRGEVVGAVPITADGRFDLEVPRSHGPGLYHLWLTNPAETRREFIATYNLAGDDATDELAITQVSLGGLSLDLPGRMAAQEVSAYVNGLPHEFHRSMNKAGADSMSFRGSGLPDDLTLEIVAGHDYARGEFANDSTGFRRLIGTAMRAKRTMLATIGGKTREVVPIRCEPLNGDWTMVCACANGEIDSLQMSALDDLAEGRAAPPLSHDTIALAARLVQQQIRSDETASDKLIDRHIVLPSAAQRPWKFNGRVILVRPENHPTDELYVTAPLRSLVEKKVINFILIDTNDEEIDGIDRNIELRSGDAVIISRYITAKWAKRLIDAKNGIKIIYIMDDDVAAAIDTVGLPAAYRRRMTEAALFDFQFMLRLCDVFVTTSPFLMRKYSSSKTRFLEPPYFREPKSLDHLLKTDKIKIVYHGTDTHKDDIGFIMPELQKLGERNENIEISIITRFRIHSENGKRAIRTIRPMPWPEYVQYTRENPAHISLAPVLDTAYNRGKSIIKFYDAASLGAVGVFSKVEPYTDVVRDGRNGFLVENCPHRWFDILQLLVRNPSIIRETAIEGQMDAKKRGDISARTAFWIRELALTL
ncbi:hypothetical protein [Zavarzinia sp.]|uniref:hypothetical protein n=1 Tax=Zavarzinia sp. TaxID=2027920 RepID=UPI0035633593